MATWQDVAAAAEAMPEVAAASGRDGRRWTTHGRLFVWERPLRKADRDHLGASAPTGDVLAVWVQDEGEKTVLVASLHDVAFTTPHFDGYPVVLLRLDELPVDVLDELVTDAWLDRAATRARTAWLTEHPQRPG